MADIHCTAKSPMKRCSQCGIIYPRTADHFSRCKRNPDGLQYQCKNCYGRYYRQHAARLKAYAKTYRTRHRDLLRKKCYLWHLAHLEHARNAANRRRMRDPEAHKRAVRRAHLKRRALERQAIDYGVPYDKLYRVWRGMCVICGRFVPKDKVSWDHITPLSKGGRHAEENIAPAHRRCNEIKGDRPLMWAKRHLMLLQVAGDAAIQV